MTCILFQSHLSASSLSRLHCGAASALPAWQVRACPDPVDKMQKMAELLGLGDECREGTPEAPATAGSCLADNRLNLDVYPDGCRWFLQLFERRRGEVVQVEFLRLSSNDHLLGTTLGILPHLKHLKSLVLKGKFWGLSPYSFFFFFFFCPHLQDKLPLVLFCPSAPYYSFVS